MKGSTQLGSAGAGRTEASSGSERFAAFPLHAVKVPLLEQFLKLGTFHASTRFLERLVTVYRFIVTVSIESKIRNKGTKRNCALKTEMFWIFTSTSLFSCPDVDLNYFLK